MTEAAFASNPWLLFSAVAGVVTIACTLIVFVTDYLRTSHQAEIDAMLKQDMLNRGMSATDIKTILEASTDGEATRLAMGGNGVRVGLGKFQVEVGGGGKTPTSGASATSH